MKEHMLEAIKRKRAMIEQHQVDSKGEHADGQGSEDSDELAPMREGSKTDALLGHPDGKNSSENARSNYEEDNQTALGQEGFDKEVHNSPENSKNLFHDPKRDTHDPVDLNRHRNMAGDGSNSKYDKMGVDEHKNVRLQSSKLAGKNAEKGEGLKKSTLSAVKDKMAIHSKMASSDGEAGKDAPDAVGDNQMQKGFKAPYSKVNRAGDKGMAYDQDKEGPSGKDAMYADEGGEGDGDEEGNRMRGRMTGLKGARAKLDGFLSKLKA